MTGPIENLGGAQKGVELPGAAVEQQHIGQPARMQTSAAEIQRPETHVALPAGSIPAAIEQVGASAEDPWAHETGIVEGTAVAGRLRVIPPSMRMPGTAVYSMSEHGLLKGRIDVTPRQLREEEALRASEQSRAAAVARIEEANRLRLRDSGDSAIAQQAINENPYREPGEAVYIDPDGRRLSMHGERILARDLGDLPTDEPQT